MKKLFFFASLFCAGMMSAQTITIDGSKSDWADVPMLTEPGAPDVVKMIVPQDGATLPSGAAYCVLVESNNDVAKANYPVVYTDADKDNSTGTAPWICPAMGYDYEMATWSSGSESAASSTGDIHELCIKQAAFSGAAFTGSVWTYLTFNWGALYIPTDPNTDGWKWSAEVRHPFNVAPYTYAPLAGTHTAAAAYSSHYALAPGESFNMSVSGGEQDTAFWASWAVEVTPGTYTVSAAVTSTDNASVDLALVDVATNAVVARRSCEPVWAPEGTMAVGTWDLSGVPAGKYMLKFSNHVSWSHMVLSSITFTAQGATGLDALGTSECQKLYRDGQVVIVRDGVEYSVLGRKM